MKTHHLGFPPKWISLILAISLATSSQAELAIEVPQGYTHRVQIQPIRVFKSNGAAANAFGSTADEAYIKEQIRRVWSQAGIRIEWLPILDYQNDFSYDGSPGNYTSNARPSDHLNAIIDNAPIPPKNSDPTIINFYFVQIVPGFSQKGTNTVNGLGVLDGNGIAAYVGSNLYNISRDGIARTLAHEIGHNLGLPHYTAASENLMTSGGSTGKLTAAQKATIFTNSSRNIGGADIAKPIPTSNYNNWALALQLRGGPNDDDDLDGVDNLIEFMFQLDPKKFDKVPQPVVSGFGLTWTLPKYQSALSDGLVYRVTTSADLKNWLPAGSDNGRSVIVTDDASSLIVRLQPKAEQAFMRLSIDPPEDLTLSAGVRFAARTANPIIKVISEPIDSYTYP